MDTYGDNRIKELTQRRRGISGKRVHITNKGQAMPKAKDWESFLHSNENKAEFIKFLVDYLKEDNVKSKLSISVIITEAANTWLITADNIEKLDSCNHHEADTRVVLHAALSNCPVVIGGTDTDILILLVFAYSRFNPAEQWYMKTARDSFVEISKISSHYGEAVCNILPAFHSITGCDTTSYPYNVGKIKPFKKMISKDKSSYLNSFGQKPLNNNMDSSMKFMQTVMYPGKDDEIFVQTRVRMHNNQKLKSSLSLIPDASSAREHIKRAELQCYIWRQCLQQTIDYPSPVNWGWEDSDNGLRPVWYLCSQLPPSILRSRKQKAKGGDDADDEASDHDASDNKARKIKKDKSPPRKRRKRCAVSKQKFEDTTIEQVIDCSLSEESTIESESLDIVTDTESDLTESEG